MAPKEAAVLSLFEVWIFLLYDLVSGCMFAENFFEKTYRKKARSKHMMNLMITL